MHPFVDSLAKTAKHGRIDHENSSRIIYAECIENCRPGPKQWERLSLLCWMLRGPRSRTCNHTVESEQQTPGASGEPKHAYDEQQQPKCLSPSAKHTTGCQWPVKLGLGLDE
jgi:hypothetical protein